MAEIKTKETEVSPVDFIKSFAAGQKQEDALVLLEMMKKITKEEPRMWGPSIIGYGSYTYKYDSGHGGQMCRLGYSPRKAALTLYVLTGADGEEELIEQLGKCKTSKDCLYINKLSDVNLPVLEKLIKLSLKEMNKRYPEE